MLNIGNIAHIENIIENIYFIENVPSKEGG